MSRGSKFGLSVTVRGLPRRRRRILSTRRPARRKRGKARVLSPIFFVSPEFEMVIKWHCPGGRGERMENYIRVDQMSISPTFGVNIHLIALASTFCKIKRQTP